VQQEDLPQSLQQEIETLCQNYASRLSGDLGRIAASSRTLAAATAATETGQVLDSLVGALRKIRGAQEAAAVLTELVESAPQFCGRAALLLHSGGRMVGFRTAGLGEQTAADEIKRLVVDLESAPALAHVIESRDTVITKGTRHNLSEGLAKRLGYGDEDDLYLHPLLLRDAVLAVLLVVGNAASEVRTPAIETLVLTAEAWIEALGSRPEGNPAGSSDES
jgi:hypothetical protein